MNAAHKYEYGSGHAANHDGSSAKQNKNEEPVVAWGQSSCKCKDGKCSKRCGCYKNNLMCGSGCTCNGNCGTVMK